MKSKWPGIRFGWAVFLLLMFTGMPSFLHAFDVSGKWYVTAAGAHYVMELTQRNEEFSGKCLPMEKNRDQDATVFGRVNGHRVTFNTSNYSLSIIRDFTGTLIISNNGWAMTGAYTENGRRNIPWHAVKY